MSHLTLSVPPSIIILLLRPARPVSAAATAVAQAPVPQACVIPLPRSHTLAPTHFLVVPKAHLASAAEVTEENAAVVGHIFAVIAKLAKDMGFADGFRVVTNCGELAGQTVHHLHFHVLSGQQLGSFN